MTEQENHNQNMTVPSTSSPFTPPPQVTMLEQTMEFKALMTIIRNKDTLRGDFIFYSDRVIRLLVEEGKNLLLILLHSPIITRI